MITRVFRLFALCFIFSPMVYAIEPVYEGAEGIREEVFLPNCLSCHASDLSGSQRQGAPGNVNFDTFTDAKQNASRAIARAVQQLSMPPTFSGLPLLNDEQKTAMRAWQEEGFPRFPSNATFDFETQILILPRVHVGETAYRAKLRFVSLPDSELGFGFELLEAEISEDVIEATADFFQASGVLEIPEVDLFSSIRLKPSPFRRTDLSQMIYTPNGLSLWQSYSL